jgi:hypothetical protein
MFCQIVEFTMLRLRRSVIAARPSARLAGRPTSSLAHRAASKLAAPQQISKARHVTTSGVRGSQTLGASFIQLRSIAYRQLSTQQSALSGAPAPALSLGRRALNGVALSSMAALSMAVSFMLTPRVFVALDLPIDMAFQW